MKTSTPFAHLHVHSDFSFCDSAASVMALADRAEELGMEYLALTDHGNMFGMMDFLVACKETVYEQWRCVPRNNPIHPVIGCEVYVTPGSRHEKKGRESENILYHLVLLASGRQGYHNLVKLCSFAYTEGFYHLPRVDDELLAQYYEGLIALSGCIYGEIPRLIMDGKTEKAEQKACYYRDLFGENNFYLEIQDQGIPAEALNGALSQKELNKAIAGISAHTGIPLVATNNVHYIRQEDAAAHDALLCIGEGKKRTDVKRKRFYGDQFYLKSADEMAALFSEYPEAVANTVKIAERCIADVPVVKPEDLPKYLPVFDIPAGFDNEAACLRHLVSEGLAKRYAKEKEADREKWKEVQRRIEYELNTIISMGFTGYFLIVADFVNWAREHGLFMGPGRGAAASSIVAYTLRITDIDPIKYDLLFERFINPERISMPDIDIDFADEDRDKVIEYISEKYGKDRVGQMITFRTFSTKSVVRDVARTVGIQINESKKISRLIPNYPWITLKEAIEEEPKLRALESDPKYVELFAIARKLEGLKHHSNVHACGVVISKIALHNHVPLYRDSSGVVAVQYDIAHLETCGLVKFDFLSLKVLDTIKHTVELIRRRGVEYANFCIADIPEDDRATFTLFCEGNTKGVFQFDSYGMKGVLKQAKPQTIHDLMALNALYRPGPMENMPQFIDSKNGRQPIQYPDPALEEVLKETYGVIVYQEQVMKVIHIIAGYSMGQADLLRRAMGRKVNLDKEKRSFIEGATQKGFSKTKAGQIFDLLVPFAGYSFCKSHAAAYAKLAYQTAYLKANFPAEFMDEKTISEMIEWCFE